MRSIGWDISGWEYKRSIFIFHFICKVMIWERGIWRAQCLKWGSMCPTMISHCHTNGTIDTFVLFHGKRERINSFQRSNTRICRITIALALHSIWFDIWIQRHFCGFRTPNSHAILENWVECRILKWTACRWCLFKYKCMKSRWNLPSFSVYFYPLFRLSAAL